MSAIVHTRKAPRAMVFVPGKGAFFAEVDVYRDGEGVVVVGEGGGVRQTPFGDAEARASFSVRFKSVQAYEWSRDKAFEKNPVAYSRTVGLLGIDDDARNAPEMPDDVRAFVEGRARALPMSSRTLPALAASNRVEVAVAGVETVSRPPRPLLLGRGER